MTEETESPISGQENDFYFPCPNCNKESAEKLEEWYKTLSLPEFLKQKAQLEEESDDKESLIVTVALEMAPFSSDLVTKIDGVCEDCAFNFETKHTFGMFSRPKGLEA